MAENVVPIHQLANAYSAHHRLVEALGSENNPAQWMQFMETVNEVIPAVLSSGRPTKEAIKHSLIGHFGFKSWREMIEAPTENNGLAWNFSAWKAWRRAWSTVEKNPWLKSEVLTSSEVNQIALKVKNSQKDNEGNLKNEGELWFPANKEELDTFILEKKEEQETKKVLAEIKKQDEENQIKLDLQRQIEQARQYHSQLISANRENEEIKAQLNEQALSLADLQQQMDVIPQLQDQLDEANRQTKQLQAKYDKAQEKVDRYQKMTWLQRLQAVFVGY